MWYLYCKSHHSLVFLCAGADREAYYQEAVKLGGGVEAQLGFAEGACKRAAPSAAAYVAARRQAPVALPLSAIDSVMQRPLSAWPHALCPNAESRGLS